MRHVLWTGGWDSTYRVLSLVMEKGISVQPYYIIDAQRQSTNKELETMELIKKELFDLDKKHKNLIKKTIFINREEIPLNKKITDAYNRLKKISFIGSQYDWLARYMWGSDTRLELSVHKDDTVNYFLSENVKKVLENNDYFYRLSPPPRNST